MLNRTRCKNLGIALCLGAMQLCYFAPLSAQPEPDLEWAYFGPEQGLGMGFLDLIQDHKGFIWMASSNGLYRYDGYKIQSYKVYSNRPTGLSSDWIWDLEEDQAGNIWMATYNGGISMWERATDRFHHYRHEPDNPNSLSSDQTHWWAAAAATAAGLLAWAGGW